MTVTTTYSDYRDVGGMRVPHRYMESNELIGRAIYQVERVEVGVKLAPEFSARGTRRIGRKSVRGVDLPADPDLSGQPKSGPRRRRIHG